MCFILNLFQHFPLESNHGAVNCSFSWIGDGACDDFNNHFECNYDGGDCCGPNVKTGSCSQCLCLDPLEETMLIWRATTIRKVRVLPKWSKRANAAIRDSALGYKCKKLKILPKL